MSESSSPSSKSVIRNTLGSRSRRPSRTVCFRLCEDVFVLLRRSVPNVSGFLRGLVFDVVERLPVYFEMEEFRLEVEIARISEELGKVHRWQSVLLKHGSYAEAYLKRLKGGLVIDWNPFHLPDPPAEVKREELLVVERIVEYRERLAERLLRKLERVMELKLSRSRDGHLHADSIEEKGGGNNCL